MILDIQDAQKFTLDTGWERLTRGWMPEVIADDAQEHYRLLGYLAGQVTDGVMLDLGTSTGMSAWSMAIGSHNRWPIHTYDVAADQREIDFAGWPVHVHVESAETITNWSECRLALLDVGHDGIVERNIIAAAIAQGFRGVMVMDDIRACVPVRELFWEMRVSKYDLSRFFHWSGTGILDFSKELSVVSNGTRMIPLGMN